MPIVAAAMAEKLKSSAAWCDIIMSEECKVHGQFACGAVLRTPKGNMLL